VILCVHRLPEDGTPVPKHVGACTYPELCFMICFFLFYQVNLLVNLLNVRKCTVRVKQEEGWYERYGEIRNEVPSWIHMTAHKMEL
jgi:hypothetical protein